MRSLTFLTPVAIAPTVEERLALLFPRVWRLVVGEDMQEIWHCDNGTENIDGLGLVQVDELFWGDDAHECGGEPSMQALQQMARRGFRNRHSMDESTWPEVLLTN